MSSQGQIPTDLIFVPACPGGFEVQVEADFLEKSKAQRVATLLIKINLHQEESCR